MSVLLFYFFFFFAAVKREMRRRRRRRRRRRFFEPKTQMRASEVGREFIGVKPGLNAAPLTRKKDTLFKGPESSG